VPTSYHLSVVVDDAHQGVTHVVRGHDLFHATSLHRLLQALLGLPQPDYHHHRLICDTEGRKLSKSTRATGLRELRADGAAPADIRQAVGCLRSGPSSD
jgi:glutamyl-Q tRNA(Asp) synthetase